MSKYLLNKFLFMVDRDPELTERRQRVANAERRGRRRQIWDWPIHHRGSCSAFKCRSDEIMAVMIRAA